MIKSLVKNEHILAYRAGELNAIPEELLAEIEEREKANKKEEKPKKEVKETK
jgi:hypothetical protein